MNLSDVKTASKHEYTQNNTSSTRKSCI
jgi:hypothetical protein